MKTHPFLFSLLIFLNLACYSTKSVYDSKKVGQNSVTTFTNPEYQTEANWFGWTVILGITAGSAYAGYASGVELQWDNNEPKREIPSANAAITGLIGGLGALVIVGALAPDAPSFSEEMAIDWTRNLDEHLRYIRLNEEKSFRSTTRKLIAIFDTAEYTFTPTTPDDLHVFTSAFPDSPENERVALIASEQFKRSQLPAITKHLPGTTGATQALERYINEAPDLASAIQAAKQYPLLTELAEIRSASLVRTRIDASSFVKAFPKSKHSIKALEKVLPKLNREETGLLLKEFTEDSARSLLAQNYLDKSKTVAEIVKAIEADQTLWQQGEMKAAEVATSTTDYRTYLATFPDGDATKRIQAALNEKLKTPEILGKSINTKADEYSPVISPDGKTLYFIRRYTTDNKGRYGDEDIWVSNSSGYDDWTTARNLHELNDSDPNGVKSVTPDGNTLLLHSGSSVSPASLTNRIAQGWSKPKALNIDDYYNLGDYLQTFLANDGRTLLLALERIGGLGEHDIYVSTITQNGEWTKPKNLGKTINTPQGDDTPFLASDGRTLYFSSSGHGGLGGRDIFVSRRLDNSWTKWTKPVNLGSPINTDEGDSFFFIPASGDVAYFASERSGNGYSDIFRVALPDDKRPLPVVLIAGTVHDRSTDKPLEATIIYEDLATGKEIGRARTDPATGDYKLTLPPGSNYGFRAEAPGYIAVNDNLDLSELKVYREQTRNLVLVPIKTGETIRLNNLFFDFGKSTLRKESFPELKRLAQLMNERSTMTVEIQGHTDSVGTENNNLRLSEIRANAVRAFLMSQGIDDSRLSVIGKGESEPVASNKTEEGKALNRRVVILIGSE